MDKIMDALLFERKDEYGHPDLPGYLPWMGPRYSFSGQSGPLSVFRGEGMALFLLARLIQPAVVIECFTGTGYAAAWLAAGWPDASVFSVDNYSENLAGEEGFRRAGRLQSRLDLENLRLLHGSGRTMQEALGGRLADFCFSDGPYDAMSFDGLLAPGAVVVRHDDRSGQTKERSFMLLGGSHLSVMCETVEQRDVLMRAIGQAFPVEKP